MADVFLVSELSYIIYPCGFNGSLNLLESGMSINNTIHGGCVFSYKIEAV